MELDKVKRVEFRQYKHDDDYCYHSIINYVYITAINNTCSKHDSYMYRLGIACRN